MHALQCSFNTYSVKITYGSNGADTEFGSELGVIGGGSSSRRPGWGHLTSRENGSVGGEITKRLVRNAEQSLFGKL